VKAIDAMLGHLYGIRAQLVSEIRRSGAGIGGGPAGTGYPQPLLPRSRGLLTSTLLPA
jgi:hypothetical protein